MRACWRRSLASALAASNTKIMTSVAAAATKFPEKPCQRPAAVAINTTAVAGTKPVKRKERNGLIKESHPASSAVRTALWSGPGNHVGSETCPRMPRDRILVSPRYPSTSSLRYSLLHYFGTLLHNEKVKYVRRDNDGMPQIEARATVCL